MGIGLIAIPIFSSIACGLTVSNKLLYAIIMQKYKNYKKQYEKHQHTIISYDKLYKKSFQDNVTDKNEYQYVCNISTKYVDETKNESFL